MKKILFVIAVLSTILTGWKEKETFLTQYTETKGSKATVYQVNPSTKLDAAFWVKIQNSLQTNPVDVIFADGIYTIDSTITVRSIGHPVNLLTLKTASTPGGAVFTSSIAYLLKFTDCRNILMQRLKFTGDISAYAVTFTNSKDITVDNCYFVDLRKVFFGALGVHSKSDNAIVKNCTFSNVGSASTAHMVYGAYGVTRLKVVNNRFTDCAGAFVRFRGNLSTHGVAYGNTFISTGTYGGGVNPGFIEVPVFNDVNPGDERMGTSFMITKNTFNYSTSGKQDTRYALVFHHSGYNPPDRNYLISPEDASLLNNGTVAQKRAIMADKLGLNGEEIRFAGNTNINVEHDVLYRCKGAYGAVASWNGIADITSAINTTGLATTEAEALAFYDNLY